MPTFLALVAITVLPILVTLGISLFYVDLTMPGMTRFAGLENYFELFQDSRFLNSLTVTAKLIFIPVALQIVIGLLLAMVLKEKLPGTGWMRMAFLLPAVIPPAVSGLVWKLFIVPGAGGLSYLGHVIGVDLSLDLLSMPGSALTLVIVTSVWVGTPFVALLMLSALESLGEEQYEAARIDGASWFQAHWHISLPEIRPVILTVAVFRILEALAIFPIIFVLTGGGPAGATEPINYYAYVNGFEYLRVDYAATIIFFFFVVMMGICSPFLINIARRESREEAR
ncbi:carbohydrate ABC transporter permease [Salipiger abyssi]|uniref:Carbohydrate ABC transporter membrane protein 1, CUT1 family n=1 Tax=Salipiger abyssi TaxID=1250539 RepID=A0A1P8UN79_9RHOB|nr:sugar ABC transporter permease [Salipiger abyssi]APZ50825.1 carbohydrate ABC transporter membrane protein 1, CUT1 family [Salipiger abyssi]